MNIPFYTIAYLPFLKQKLPKEIEEDIKKLEADIFYVKNSKQLEKILKDKITFGRENDKEKTSPHNMKLYKSF